MGEPFILWLKLTLLLTKTQFLVMLSNMEPYEKEYLTTAINEQIANSN